MNAAVTDTHALLWYLLEPPRLSAAAVTAFLNYLQRHGIGLVSSK